ncbi:MAG: nuclear transport factor 2 family protein [Gemmatimonadota bacterium]|nr:nuclear transport factor 2 family protein [Gemmatimonadota bacterium]
MTTSPQHERPEAAIERLAAATNARDLDALVDCFTTDYRNETPLHPSRSFVGRDQVRRNWEQIFAHVPDLKAVVVRSATSDQTVWSEWEMRGTRRDGAPHLMRGVIIFGIRDDRAEWARFYLEPAQDTGEDANAAVRSVVTATGARPS